MTTFLNRAALAGLLALGMAGTAAAEFEPRRPLEIVVHAGPGSGNDLFARELTSIIDKHDLSPVRVQVENRAGGGSAIAAAYLAGKPGNENTIAVFTNIWMTDPRVSADAKVSLGDLTPIAILVEGPALVVVPAASPYQTFEDFIARAKADPGGLSQSLHARISCGNW